MKLWGDKSAGEEGCKVVSCTLKTKALVLETAVVFINKIGGIE